MSKSKAFSPLTSLTSLPGAQALEESGDITEPGVDGQDPAGGFVITARPASPAGLAWVPVPDGWADVDAAPSPALQDGADSIRAWGLPWLAVAGPPAAAQQPRSGPEPLLTPTDPIFGTPVVNPFGLTDVGTSATPTFADIDADGDLDAFVGKNDGNTQFFRNTGSVGAPSFAAEGSNFGLTQVGAFAAPTLSDIDGDGDLDAFVGKSDGITAFFRNDGSAGAPAFVADGNNFGLEDVGMSAKPSFADIDGDGDLDAFVGNSTGNTSFFRNSGSANAPAFALAGNNFGLTDVGSWASPTLVDIDGDGDLDALIGATDGSVRFFVNNAPGVAVTQSGGRTAVTEGGATDSYTVVLRTQPASDVTITLDTTTGQLGASAATLVFTPANWSVAQTVTVTARDDSVGEGSHRGVIRHTTNSLDAAYNDVVVSPVRVAVTDDDLAGVDPTFGSVVLNPFGLAIVGSYASPTFADIDADGDLDAVVGNGQGNVLFFRNVGTTIEPSFRPAGDDFGLSFSGYFAKPAFADIDADGDLDAFVGSDAGGTRFLRNTGSASAPAFTDEGANPFGLANAGSFSAPTFADIDADGDLDAFVGDGAGTTQFFRNVGSASAPAFIDAGSNLGLTDVGFRASPSFADIDGDGDLDAFVGNLNGISQFFRNTGSAGAPAFTAEGSNLGLPDVGSVAAPTFADIDGDGDLDAFVGDVPGTVRFFVNNAAPNITLTQSGGATRVGEAGDVDSYTVVLSTAPTANVIISLDTTNAQLNVSATTLVFTPANWNQAQTVTVTAFDDAVGEGGHRGVIGHSVSSTDAAYNGVPMAPLRVAIGDDDLARGDPAFAAPVSNPFGLPDVGTYASPTFADIDADGDLDAFVGYQDGTVQLFRNTGSAGTPVFVAEGSNFGLTDVGGYARPNFGDIDGDGDLDAFVGNDGGLTQFFRNTGSAAAPAFTAEGGNFGLTDVGGYAAPALADIDGDGDLDAFVGNGIGNTQFFRNTGNAAAPAFTAEGSNFGLPDIGTSAIPTFADVDGDGDLDVFFGEESGETRFFRNTGSASAPAFTAEGTNRFGLTDVGSFVSPTLADIDADGDLDALFGIGSGTVHFFVNNSAFDLEAPSTIQYTDTAFDDSFASVSSTLSSRGVDSTALSWGINGGADNGSTVSKTSAYGVLTVTKASGAYSFVPNDAGIEALGTNLSVSFQVTASNGTRTEGRTLTLSLVQSGSTETAGNDTLTGTAGNDRLAALDGNDSVSGGDGNDSLYGVNGADTLAGGNGNDLLDGGNSADSMTGGAGNDRYVVQGSGDKVIEASGGGTDSVSSSITYKLPSYVETLTLSGPAAINGTGNSSNNTVTGNSGINNLSGGDGNDSLYGMDDVDTLTGGNGNDLLDGGSGADSLTGGAGNDRYVVQGTGDKVVEASGGGTDSVSSSIAYTLPANVEGLTLTGSAAINGIGNTSNNRLTGNTAINSLSGGSGNDVLDGGAGNDSLTGGAGLDTFRFSSALSGSNVDRLPDFNVADDTLQLENAIFTKLAATGALTPSFFRANTTGSASDSNDFVLYETDTGKLFYDADGSGAGAKVLIATLTTMPLLTSADIFVT